jgi:hypothetical protein
VRFRVRVGPLVEAAIAERFGTERSPEGRPSRADFESGPLAAARLQFERFDALPEAMGPSVRQCHVLIPGFGPVVFMAVLVASETVEIAGFEDDPDYWDLTTENPGQ